MAKTVMTKTVLTRTRRTGLMLALVTAVISGFAIFLNSYGVKAVGNATVYTTAKNVVAALVLFVVVAVGRTRGVTVSRPQGRGQWWGLVAVGVIGGSVPFVLFFEGLARASSTQAAFLNKTLVLWVALLAVVILKERLQVWHWIAIGLLLVGQAGLSGGFTASIASGELLILAATLLWAVEVVVAKRLLGSLSSWTVGLARMGFGSVALIGWVLATGSGAALLTMDAAQWGWVLLTGVILAGYVATWFAALARAQAVDVTAVLVLAALITAGLNAVVNGTPLAPQLGWLLMLAAGGTLVCVVAWRRAPRELPAAA
jgi:drug/metabolite transporter (DMT)-like permease